MLVSSLSFDPFPSKMNQVLKKKKSKLQTIKKKYNKNNKNLSSNW